MAAEIWNPLEKPFRLTVVVPSSQPGLCGWSTRTPVMFRNLSDAIAEAQKPQAGALKVRVDEAINGATWNRNGRWKKHFERRVSR